MLRLQDDITQESQSLRGPRMFTSRVGREASS